MRNYPVWPERLDPVEKISGIEPGRALAEVSGRAPGGAAGFQGVAQGIVFELVHKSGKRSRLSVGHERRIGVRTRFRTCDADTAADGAAVRRPGEGFSFSDDVKVEESGDRTVISFGETPSGETRMVVEHCPARIYFERSGATLCGEHFLDRNVGDHPRTFPVSRGYAGRYPGWCGAMKLEADEALFGFGEKFTPCNRRGQRLVLWNHDAFGVGTEDAYKNVPFFWTTRGYGCLFNTYSRVYVDAGYPGRSSASLAYFVESDELDIVWFFGEPKDVIRAYTELTGRGPDLPAWVFGIWVSRCYYKTQEEALAVARKFREMGLPCDCITMDGRAWLDVETRCDFRWYKERVPDPEALISGLKRLGYRLCVWEYPYISVKSPLYQVAAQNGFFLKDSNGEPYVFEWDPLGFNQYLSLLSPSSIVDLTNPAAAEWYKSLHIPLLDQGVDVFKTDFGEQVPEDCYTFDGRSGREVHNEFAVTYNKTVYEVTLEHGKSGGLVFGRSGWAGSQRYPVQWGGDSQASWDGLAFSVRGGIGYCASGVPLWTSDVGGFYGDKPDLKLYIRWLQFGTFCPLMRLHGTTPREPWEFGEKAVDVYREYAALKYKLVPYVFSEYSEARRTGVPVMRHLAIEFPQDTFASKIDDEYMLGGALLVAPVTSPSDTRDIYFPEGLWYDLWTGEPHQGRSVIALKVPLERIPVFGRHGYAIPIGPEMERIAESLPRVEEIWSFGEQAGTLLVDPRLIGVSEFDLADPDSMERLSAAGIRSVRLYRGGGVESHQAV